MKTQIFKNMMPFAVAALGIIGAFTTTSMQRAEKEMVLVNAYNPSNCQDIVKQCDNQERTFICSFSGNQLYGKDNNGNCTETLWQEQP
ncbi:hypothetical protein [Flavobacterium sp. 22076]|uniref:hypothetical protein n=1 Tax=unclassified Flavobacterium TaxID=196869 RepID=UPI003F875A78